MMSAAVQAICLAALVAAAPLPCVEDGTAALGPGESLRCPVDLESDARVTYIVSADAPVAVSIAPPGEEPPPSPSGLFTHRTERLSQGSYALVITNMGASDADVAYQVRTDSEILGGLTAKNAMALTLALAVASLSVALMIAGRRR